MTFEKLWVIRVEERVHRQIKVQAAEAGLTMAAWLTRAIEGAVVKGPSAKRAAAQSPKAVDVGLPSPGLEAPVLERKCRKCGHPEGKHRPTCILMGCVCQRFAE